MASELRVNTLKDASGNNSVGMSYIAEGTAKFWVRYDQSNNNLDDSFKVSSVSDDEQGKFSVNLSSAFSVANHPAVVGATREINTNSSVVVLGYDPDLSTSSSIVIRVNSDDSGAIDQAYNGVAGFGDLA